MTALSLQTAAALSEALARLDSRADRLRKQDAEDAWRDAQDAKPIDWKAEATRWKASFENSERSHAVDRRKLAQATELLEELLDWFDNRADVEDGDYGEPRPNSEMQQATSIKWMLESLK